MAYLLQHLLTEARRGSRSGRRWRLTAVPHLRGAGPAEQPGGPRAAGPGRGAGRPGGDPRPQVGRRGRRAIRRAEGRGLLRAARPEVARRAAGHIMTDSGIAVVVADEARTSQAAAMADAFPGCAA